MQKTFTLFITSSQLKINMSIALLMKTKVIIIQFVVININYLRNGSDCKIIYCLVKNFDLRHCIDIQTSMINFISLNIFGIFGLIMILHLDVEKLSFNLLGFDFLTYCTKIVICMEIQ